jgi:NADH:ubiquinone oxidoreductase subunit 5 (subunit L)/multisubunit Na+/H+ antiporter MnhA subunit
MITKFYPLICSDVQNIIAIVAVTSRKAATIALVQTDIKKVFAGSPCRN